MIAKSLGVITHDATSFSSAVIRSFGRFWNRVLISLAWGLPVTKIRIEVLMSFLIVSRRSLLCWCAESCASSNASITMKVVGKSATN